MDREISKAEMRRMRDDLINRQIHDQKMASDILRMSEDEWKTNGQFCICYQKNTTKRVEDLQINLNFLKTKFSNFTLSLVARNDIKFASKLARDAVVSCPTETNCGKTLMENCVICFEDIDASKMFSVDGCLHRFCFSCMKQHVEVKLLNGMMANCPHEGCKFEVKIESCGEFLDPKVLDIMKQRIKEVSIPVSEKVYCPYPRCSVLMSKSEVLEYTNNKSYAGILPPDGARKCNKCLHFFCINCKVPWHYNLTCDGFKRSKSYRSAGDGKLASLATKMLWRHCVKCNNMIELAQG